MNRFLATCPEETKNVLIEELESFGACEVSPGYKLVSFKADTELYYKLHLNLATASNLYTVLRECSAKNPKMLYSQARRVKWSQVFTLNKSFKVDGIAGDRGQDAMSSNEISKQLRAAIENHFYEVEGKKPKVCLKEPQVLITCMVYRGKATICVNTSGKALHKRAYRIGGHPAPLKETMAASLLKIADFKGQTTFLDPMCGSGTIAIEAAFLALNKACNIHRKKGQFGLEHLKSFDRVLWRSVQEKLREGKKAAVDNKIYACDLNPNFVSAAKENALRARVEKFIDFQEKSFFDLNKPEESGVLIANLPYGERLDAGDDSMESFYRKIGDHLKKNFSSWQAYLFVNQESPWKHMGLKPSRKIPLLNGSIKTKLLVYDLYSGSKKAKHKGV
ncbi:MAG: class I SAM-dependent RNA methyltransferase [Oligoflexales bacterium]